MPTPDELIALFGDDFDDVLKGLNALPLEVRQLLDDTMGKMIYDSEVFAQRVNKTIQTQGARGITFSNTAGMLATDMAERGRVFGELRNSIKESLVEGINQSGQAGSFQAYDPEEKTIFTWVTVAGHKICHDCSPRGGQRATLKEWEEQGMPATGWSVCGGYCYCILDPSGKISPRVEFEKVQEKGATIKPKPKLPATPTPAPKSPPLKKPITKRATTKLTDQQRLESFVSPSKEGNTYHDWMRKKHGATNFDKVSKANLKIIANAVEDTLGKYNIKVNYLGLFTRDLSSRGANAAAWGRNGFGTSIGWSRGFVTGAKKRAARNRIRFAENKALHISYEESVLKNLKKRKAAGDWATVGDDMILASEKRLAVLNNPRFDKWSISSVADDPLYATSKHESWHQIDYQLADKPLTGMKNGIGGIFQKKLNKY